MNEIAYVDECTYCGTQFIGMSPEELRQEHSKDCTPLLELKVFPDE